MSALPSASKTSRDYFPWACLICSLPVLLATYPPMVDMPQHAGQIAALKSLWFEHGWKYADLFQVNALTPYWLGYLIILFLSVPFGIVWATKLTISLAASLFVWSAARFCTRMGMPPEWRWALLVLPFGAAYQWGFLNFLVAAPFGFLFLTALVDLRGKSDWRSCLHIALWLHFLFFAHVLVTAFVCMLGMLLLAHPWAGFREWMRRCTPIFTILPVTGIWLWNSLHDSPAAGHVIWWIDFRRITDFLPALVSSPTHTPGLLVGVFMLLLPFLFGATPKKSWIQWTPFGLYAAWMLFFPHDPGGVAFAYERFGIFGLPLYLICFEAKESQTTLRSHAIMKVGLVLIAFASISWQVAKVYVFNSEVVGYQSVIKHAESGGRMLMLPLDPTSKTSSTFLMLHFGSWYQAENGGLVDFSFAGNWMQPLQYRPEAMPGVTRNFEWNPGSLDWGKHGANNYDYFLVRYPMDASQWLEEKSGGSVELLARSGDWQLYGRTRMETPAKYLDENQQPALEKGPP